MADLRPLLTLIWVISGKLREMAGPLLKSKMFGFKDALCPGKKSMYRSIIYTQSARYTSPMLVNIEPTLGQCIEFAGYIYFPKAWTSSKMN